VALVDDVILFPPLGSIDSLSPARSPATLAGVTVYVAAPRAASIPAPASFLIARTMLEIRGEKGPVTQATGLRLAACTALTSAL